MSSSEQCSTEFLDVGISESDLCCPPQYTVYTGRKFLLATGHAHGSGKLVTGQERGSCSLLSLDSLRPGTIR